MMTPPLTWARSPILAHEIYAQEPDVMYIVTRHTAFGFTQNKHVAYAGELKLGTFEADLLGFAEAKSACQAHANTH